MLTGMLFSVKLTLIAKHGEEKEREYVNKGHVYDEMTFFNNWAEYICLTISNFVLFCTTIANNI